MLRAVLAAFVTVQQSRSRISETTLAGWARAQHIQDQGHLAVAHDRGAGRREIPLSCLPSGLTTISSVSLISSTTRPNCRPSACSTTMLTTVSFVDWLAAASSCNSRFR